MECISELNKPDHKVAWNGFEQDQQLCCSLVGCDSWAIEEGEGLAWRPRAEWPWTSETWSSCVESRHQVVLWADQPIRHHINTLFFRLFSHLVQLLVPNSSLIPCFFPHRPLSLYFSVWMAVRLRHLYEFLCEYSWQLFTIL